MQASDAAPATPAPSGVVLDLVHQGPGGAAGVPRAGVVAHLEALQRLADDNGGNRASPSPGYDASVDHVTGVLGAAGYEVTAPRYRLPKKRRRDGRTWERNVLASTRTGDPRWILLVGAHLDSVRKGPGVNDNASGVAALLAIAEHLGGSPATRSVVRFAFWGSEEDDLAGSAQYVRQLSRREREDVQLYVNVDMIASPNAGYFVMGGEGKGRAQRGPRGSGRAACVLVEQLAATGVVATTLPFDDESDHAPFVHAGIPTVGVLAGDRLRKTGKQARRWGGRAGERFDPHYHSARDRLDTLDLTALDRFTRALAGTVLHYAVPLGDRSR